MILKWLHKTWNVELKPKIAKNKSRLSASFASCCVKILQLSLIFEDEPISVSKSSSISLGSLSRHYRFRTLPLTLILNARVRSLTPDLSAVLNLNPFSLPASHFPLRVAGTSRERRPFARFVRRTVGVCSVTEQMRWKKKHLIVWRRFFTVSVREPAELAHQNQVKTCRASVLFPHGSRLLPAWSRQRRHGWKVGMWIKQTQCVERARRALSPQLHCWLSNFSAYFRADKHIPDTFASSFAYWKEDRTLQTLRKQSQLFLRWELLVVRGPIQGRAQQFSTYADATWIQACLGKSKRAILAEEKKGYWNVCNELWRICWGGGGGGGGGFRMSCYLGALIISVIKPSGNTCTAWIIHQQLQGHLVRFVFFFFPPSPWPSKTSQSVTGKARMSERRQSQFGLKPPTRKWEVQKGKRRRKV